MQLANHHAHSDFSDGRGKAETYLQQAIAQGLKTYGFSDHAPIPIEGFGHMQAEDYGLTQYLAEIDRLKAAYGDRIGIYKSLEVDYIPEVISLHSPHIVAADLDYSLGAVHFVGYLNNGLPWGFEGDFDSGLQQIFGGDARAAVTRYYELMREMISGTKPQIVAHLDRIKKRNAGEKYFSESADWYRQEVMATLETVAAAGSIMEVNMKGYYQGETDTSYPSPWILEQALQLDIPVHLSSDAHDPEKITGGFDFGAEIIYGAGYRELTILLDGEFQPVPLQLAQKV